MFLKYIMSVPTLHGSILQAEHKIQSASGPLDMRLVQVPKMLSVLRKDWAPMAFCISFKVRCFSTTSLLELR
jgi:hypothetical protein